MNDRKRVGGRPALALSPAARDLIEVFKRLGRTELRFAELLRGMVALREARDGVGVTGNAAKKVESVRTARGLRSLQALGLITSVRRSGKTLYSMGIDLRLPGLGIVDPTSHKIVRSLGGHRFSEKERRGLVSQEIRLRTWGLLSWMIDALLRAAWSRTKDEEEARWFAETFLELSIRPELMELTAILEANRPLSEAILGDYLRPVMTALWRNAGIPRS